MRTCSRMRCPSGVVAVCANPVTGIRTTRATRRFWRGRRACMDLAWYVCCPGKLRMQATIRSLASDTAVYGVSSVIQRFLTFLLTPLYTNYLTKGEIGDVTAIYAMIAFVNIVYSLGLEPAYMRFFDRNDAAASTRVFGTAYRIVFLLGLAVTALTMLFASPIAASPWLQLQGNASTLVMTAALIPLIDALILLPFARLRMLRKPKRFAMLRLFNVVVNVILNVVLVIVLGWRVQGVLWAGVIASAMTLLLLMPDILEALRGSFDRAMAIDMLRFGLPTVPSNLSSIMVQVADRPIMLLLMGNAAVGMYQTNFRLAIPMMLVVTVFEYAWKPFYLHHRDDPQAKDLFVRVLTLFTVGCGIVFLGTSLWMPYIVKLPFIGGRFINPEYWSGLDIVPIILFAYFFNGVFVNLVAGFHITKRTGYFPIVTGIAAVVSVVATYLLVPVMGIEGAAWAKVAAYVVSVIAIAIPLSRIYPVRYDVVRVGAAVACAGIIYAVVHALPPHDTIQIAARLVAIPLYLVVLMAVGVIGVSTLRSMLPSRFIQRS
ncbi:MAG: hypothetical protein FGM24_01440 [Candidatus Kapabacteria bacterium]|nr:hypothetical protein [Candidatus Kapabacteria bacterium]